MSAVVELLAALERAYDLDVVAGREPRLRPLGAAHHSAVDGDGEEARLGVDAALGQELGDRRHRHLRLFPVDAQPRHKASTAGCASRASPAKRSGENGRAISGSIPVSI